MTLKKLSALLRGAILPGVYRFPSRAHPATIQRLAEHNGWRYGYIDGRKVNDKATFLHEFATTLNFPAYFGYNWDAFEEVMLDLAEGSARDWVILYDDVINFATNAPAEWATALAILEAVVAERQQRGRPTVILLRKSGTTASTIPRLS